MKEAEASQQQVLDTLSKDSSANALSTLKPRYEMAIVLRLNGEWSQVITIFMTNSKRKLNSMVRKHWIQQRLPTLWDVYFTFWEISPELESF